MKTKFSLETTFFSETGAGTGCSAGTKAAPGSSAGFAAGPGYSAGTKTAPGTERSDTEAEGLKGFAEELCRILRITAGLEKDRVHYKKSGDYPPTDGDRILVECEKNAGYTEVCGVYVEDLYEDYRSGIPMDQIISTVMKQLKSVKDSGIMKKMDDLHSYEAARGDLFIRLLNLERHEKGLSHAIYRTVGDIALVLYMRMGNIGGCPTNMKITRETADKWNVDAETVFQNALLNTFSISPPRIYCWEKLIFDENYDGENFMSPLSDFQLRKDAVGNCLSTSSRTNGAVAVFLPGVARRLSELLGHSFYMAFTSIHEVMIHNDTQVEPDELREVLKETIRETTPASDVLSLKIYHYDKDTCKFSVV